MPYRLVGPGRGTSMKKKEVGMAMEMKQLMRSVLVILCVCTLIRFTAADPENGTVWNYCGNSGKYAYNNGSVFHLNLNKVLDSLVRNVYPNGFNISSVVEVKKNNSSVYGLVQCIEGLNSSDCQLCSSTAKEKLVAECNYTSGFILLNGCFLRYDNHNFYDELWMTQSSQRGLINTVCNGGKSDKPSRFTDVVNAQLSNITNKAAHSSKLFGAGLVTDPSNSDKNIYSLAQCWRDLSRTNCGSCLTFALQEISLCLTGATGATGALGAQFNSENCYLRYEVYEFFNASFVLPQELLSSPAPSPHALLPSLPPGESPPSFEGKRPGTRPRVLGIILGVVAATIALFVATGLWKWNICAHLKRRQVISRTGDDAENSILTPTIANRELIFEYDIMRDATSNFNEDNKLGEGGFGCVFKGVLPNGREVAVKRLYMGTRHGDAEFLNEANLIGRVQHRNLVKLLGCCIEGLERLLVYEYHQNSSLDKILFDETKRHLLDWKRRYEIIVGTARGLAYLHEESDVRIIHRDIKASNILLDYKHRPKIADFGLARLCAEDESHVSTRVAGTLGYMAPEYALRGQLTEKADVFSFGVLMLEVISGRKNQSSAEGMEFLIEGTWRLYNEDRALEIIDSTLEGSYSSKEGIRVIKISLLCTQAAAALRPSMSRVVSMLINEKERLPSPTGPAFIDTNSMNAPHQVKRGRVMDPDKSSSSTASSSTTPCVIHSAAADPLSGSLEPR